MENLTKGHVLNYTEGFTPEEKHRREVANLLKRLFDKLTSHAPNQNQYKSINDYLLDAAVFLGSFNKRPDIDVWYSEKTLTEKQKQDYEQAIEELTFAIERIFNTGSKNK